MFGEALVNGRSQNGPVRADAFARALVPVMLPAAVVAGGRFRIRLVVKRHELGTRRSMELAPVIRTVSSKMSLKIYF